MNSAECLGRLRLTHTRRSEEDEGADRAVRVLQPGPGTPHRIRDGGDRLVLPDHPLAEMLLEVREALSLGLHQAGDRDAGPLGDHGRDVVGLHLLLQVSMVLLQLVETGGGRVDRLRRLGDLTVLDLRGAVELTRAGGAVGLDAELVHPGLQRPDLVDHVLLRLPRRLHALALLAQLGELGLDDAPALTGRPVRLLLEGLALDLELRDAALDLVDGLRQRVDLDAEPARRLVDEVDRLVGEEASADVSVRELRRRDDRVVGDPHPVMDFVALLQPAQDRHRVFHGRWRHEDRLEAPLERRVLLDVPAELVERGRADHAQLSARERRLEHVARVDGALRRTGPDDRVHLVDEDHVPAVALGDLLEHRLHALLELAAVLRAREHRSDIELQELLVGERGRHVALDHPLRQTLHDRGLPHARLTDEDRIVLRATGEDLDDAADLFVPPDDRIEPALAGLFREVAAESAPEPGSSPPGWRR